MSDKPLTDYEKYIRTEELLSLQKPVASQICHDELQFQTVHQVSELWMKLVEQESAHLGALLVAGDCAQSTRTLARMRSVLHLLHEQMALLDTMSPRDYMTIRGVLGRGSGQESPGFKRMLALPAELWPSFVALLARRQRTLREVYEVPERDADLYNVAEGLVDYDQGLQAWRQRHLTLVYRIIGTGTPSLKGKPSELLAEGMKHRFFPELWTVRDELFAEWTRTHPGGATHGYHG